MSKQTDRPNLNFRKTLETLFCWVNHMNQSLHVIFLIRCALLVWKLELISIRAKLELIFTLIYRGGTVVYSGIFC